MIELQSISQAEIFDALDRGVTVVTGNKRLAAATRLAYERSVVDKGFEVWPTPDLLPWTAWLQRVWEEAVVSGVAQAPELLLTPEQEQRLWEDILTETVADQPLQQVSGTVRRAQDAWQLIQSWRLSLNRTTFRYNWDSTAFFDWALRFETRCTEKNWLPLARLPDEIKRSFQTGVLVCPAELLLIGFDELTPQQQVLLQTMIEAGCDVRWMQVAGQQSQALKVGCVDARHEAKVMARWVRQRLEQNPDASIAVVVPELASQRDILVHALDQTLVPQALKPGHQSVDRPYNISLGQPLSSYPIISTALKLLGLLAPSISLEDGGRLLRSPFVAGWQQEASARALLDGRLRETGELQVAPSTLRYHATQTTKPYFCPILADSLDAWIQAARDCPRKNSPAQWSERFAALLKLTGWARGRSLSSEEYQAAEAWQELLAAFATLEPVTQPMSASAALSQLRRMAAERTFQPQSAVVPVQVLGLLEVGGLQFDSLWIMGLHDGIWPSAPRPNPFIPLPLQREAGLPHSSEARELQVSRTMTQRILASAAEVIVSYPQRSGDEMLRPSPLIASLASVDSDSLGLWSEPSWLEAVHRSASLSAIEADCAPPLLHEDVSGGSAVFKFQAACPFRAFAELRLGARSLRQADIGLDAMARGSLVHRVLEKVWQALDTQELLMALDITGLSSLVGNAVDAAIEEIANRYPQTFTRRFRELEAERLGRQVLEWLELEKQRLPFRVVELEGKHGASAGGVRVRLKVDRIDALADGRLVVIDYKTGVVKPAQWFGERPDEPQLPLYSMAVDGDIAGLLFAQVKAGDMAFNGVTDDDALAPGVKSYEKLSQTREADSWSDVLNDWRATMERLGEAFRNGEASVDPKQYPGSCQYCELKPLCRIYELRLQDEASSEAEDAHE